MEKVIFVGAGPGAPDLLTIRGKEIIDSADVVIYAGSLVNPAVLSGCKESAEIYNSAGMTLEDVMRVMEKAAEEGKKVARVHTGDPSLYGAEQEQMRELDRLGIPYEVVPGVSSFLAAAASLKREYTLPGVSQSLILTRMEGRTAVPQSESIESLASHQASMVIFLSIAQTDILCGKLIAGGYPPETPAVVVYKATWDDERVLKGTLGDIAGKVRQAGITRTALLLVGRFLEDDFENSKLYDRDFSHGFRSAKTFRARRLMVQGTMSSAGKSFVTAAFCRIFRQDGYTVAPFKSQNMALNSFVTAEGLEIGRAQAMQAEAAGLEAEAAMNPILLKPAGDEESQVIVRGEVAATMSAAEYYGKKASLMPVIEESFEELADAFDIVVIEGAGSPAEINLKDDDIVNMGIARMADAPVILVADIDRGGVFAQIVGTVELLEPDERARIKGIIINKFRGDADLLRPGIEPIEKRLGIPVIGIIPMAEIDLDEEDSLAPRLENHRITPSSDTVDIAVVRLPHISNFTDFSVLERCGGVSLSYVTDTESLYQADLIILPGTKNTLGDLAWLKASGLAAAIKDIAEERKVPVIGICGGYQMLGGELSDPDGVEGEKGTVVSGLGLLPVRTVFAGRKTRSRSTGVLTREAVRALAGADASEAAGGDEDWSAASDIIEGYEIHMGKTFPSDDESSAGCSPLLQLADGSMDGCIRSDGLCLGTYLHGLFDNTRFTARILEMAGAAKGISGLKPDRNVRDYRETQYDRLADLVRCSVDMDAVYAILNGSVAMPEEEKYE